MQSYLDILFEPEQEKKLEILSYLLNHNDENFVLTDLLQHSSVKKLSTLKAILRDISEDIEDNYYRDEACRLDPQAQMITGFNYSELEQMKHYYFERSTYFRLFDCLLTERYTTAEVIAQECDLSRSQYYKAIKQLNERMRAFSIRIENRQLVGKEYIIRFIASHLYAHYLHPDAVWFNNRYYYAQRHMEGFLDGIVVRQGGIGQHWLTCCHYVTKLRITNRHFTDPEDNKLVREDLFETEGIGQTIYQQFLAVASNDTVIKLSREQMCNELIYFLHVVPLSGYKFENVVQGIIKPEVSALLRQAEAAMMQVFNANAREPMSVENSEALFQEVKTLFCTMIAFRTDMTQGLPRALSHELMEYYPIGFAVATAMLDAVLDVILVCDDCKENRNFWYSELGPEFIYIVVAYLEYQKLMPKVTVAMEFSHAFNVAGLTRLLFKMIPEVELTFVQSTEEADVLITNVARQSLERTHDLRFFYNGLPSHKEWEDMKAKIIRYSVERYQSEQLCEIN